MPDAPTSKSARTLCGASLLVALLLGHIGHVGIAAADPAPPPNEAARAQARALMQEGARQMEDRQYDRAVESFTEAHRLVPSPKVLFNLGIAYLSVARYADALQALEGFLKEATDAPAASQDTARRHIADLRAKVVTLELKSDRPGAELSLDGRSYGAVTFDHPLVIDPGVHALHAQAGADQVDQTFTAEAGQPLTVTLTFTPAPPPIAALPAAAPPPEAGVAMATSATPAPRSLVRRPWFWMAVGGTAAAVVAVILVVTLSHTDYPAVDARVAGP